MTPSKTNVMVPGNITDCDRFVQLIRTYEENERRDYYYNLALQNVRSTLDEDEVWYRSDELVVGGLMLLMYTWNFATPLTKQLDVTRIQTILEAHHEQIEGLRNESLVEADLDSDGTVSTFITEAWDDFQGHFGQTGTSKAWSLLCPDLFVMWDQEIRTRSKQSGEDMGIYFYMKESGFDPPNNSTTFGQAAEDYLEFLRYCKQLMLELEACEIPDNEDTPAKRLDEALYAFYKIEHG